MCEIKRIRGAGGGGGGGGGPAFRIGEGQGRHRPTCWTDTHPHTHTHTHTLRHLHTFWKLLRVSMFNGTRFGSRRRQVSLFFLVFWGFLFLWRRVPVRWWVSHFGRKEKKKHEMDRLFFLCRSSVAQKNWRRETSWETGLGATVAQSASRSSVPFPSRSDESH